jgi:hypothetical protein
MAEEWLSRPTGLGWDPDDYAGMAIAETFGFKPGKRKYNYRQRYHSPKLEKSVAPIYAAALALEKLAAGQPAGLGVDATRVISPVVSTVIPGLDVGGLVGKIFGGGDRPSGEEKKAAGEKAATPINRATLSSLNLLAQTLQRYGVSIPDRAPGDFTEQLWTIIYKPAKAAKRKGKAWPWHRSAAKLAELADNARAQVNAAFAQAAPPAPPPTGPVPITPTIYDPRVRREVPAAPGIAKSLLPVGVGAVGVLALLSLLGR